MGDGRGASAYVMINAKLGSEGSLFTYLKGMGEGSGVVGVSGVFGQYDIVLEMAGRDLRDLEEKISFLKGDSKFDKMTRYTLTLKSVLPE